VRAQGPVVSAPGVVALRQRLADAALGRAFLLQAGDCAERVHADTTPGAATAALRRQLRVIAQMAAVLRVRARVPVVAVGRIAGQYAKPRSNDWETVSAGAGADVAARLPVFRGDSINGFTPTATARAHDPARLLAAHAQSCATARRIERVAPTAPVPAVKGADTVVLAAGAGQEGDMRSVRELLQLCCHGVGCSQCGFDVESDAEADNADADTGNDAAVVADATAAVHGGVFGRHCEAQRDYRALVSRHLEATGSGAETAGPLLLPPADEPVCFTSHEGLVLGYEAANLYATDGAEPGAETAADAGAGQAAAAPLCLSGHLVWIGERTRSLGQAHAEFFRGLGNPLAVKVGPTVTGPELGALLAVLDPAREPGRVTVITRLGAGRVSASLPPLVAAARMGGHTVLWCCDPMHGNTFTAPGGVKTRAYDAVLLEIQETAAVLAACGGFLGGVHLEVTGDRVTECLGGPCGVRVADLRRRYTSLCDPRLNYSQALAVAFAVADTLVALHKQSSAGDATGQSMS
jgi:3-deoxy-7-phosphoheptulonate synthase